MWQYLITGLIVTAAITFAVYRLLNYFTDPLRKCKDCSSSCGGCALEELKKAKDKGKRTKDEGRKIREER